jgi:Na+-transporting NADH:ubiquinone oxidoreductase subunit F
MVHTANPRKTTFIFGGNKVADIYLKEMMRRFEMQLPRFQFIPTVVESDPSWEGQIGLVTEVIDRNFSNSGLQGYEGYLCGSPGMIEATLKVLERLGVNPEKIYYDKYT